MTDSRTQGEKVGCSAPLPIPSPWTQFTARMFARWRRFWYLLLIGMWRGESAIDGFDAYGSIRVIGAGRKVQTGVWHNWRIWWERRS